MVLAVVAVRLWVRHRSRAALWAALTWGALGAVLLLGRLLPDDPGVLVERTATRLLIVLLLVFPYLLYRFATSFDPPSRAVDRVLTGVSLALVVWTFAAPAFPQEGEPRPAWFQVYLSVFLVHWSVLSMVAAVKLWRAGRGQPSVARRRMRLLSGAAAGLTAAILATTLAGGEASVGAAAAQLLALVSAVAFLLGLDPPLGLRLIWRIPEQRRLQTAIQELMTATTPTEVAARVLPPTAEIVGAEAVELRGPGGENVALHGRHPAAGEPLLIRTDGWTLALWASPYAPFFGEDELDLVNTLAALANVSLDRARLFEEERTMRLELERADEVKTNFIALAAHELRTPVTTIHGFVQTLNQLGDRLTSAQQEELQEALESETSRMALLVEQLLDLSRLDADAVDIRPQALRVRQRVEEVLRTAAPRDAGSVAVDVPDDLEAMLDPSVLERIVVNLVTNAFRYGEPPVRVAAEQSDRHFRLTVEDRGPGVPDEFVPDLFERFTRSDLSRRTSGTGLGLAIARSYARAHGGDLMYEQAAPRGARFRVVIPAVKAS